LLFALERGPRFGTLCGAANTREERRSEFRCAVFLFFCWYGENQCSKLTFVWRLERKGPAAVFLSSHSYPLTIVTAQDHRISCHWLIDQMTSMHSNRYWLSIAEHLLSFFLSFFFHIFLSLTPRKQKFRSWKYSI
jgi:hypothetical protein